MSSIVTEHADARVDDKGYAHPEALVSTEWLAAHLDDPSLRVLESDEDVLLYNVGHIRGAQKIDWHTDLNNPITARLRRSRAASRNCCAVSASTSRRR